MDPLDKAIQDLFNQQAGARREHSTKGKDCLTALMIHHYLERKINPRERKKIEQHLVDCYDCLQIMVETSKAKTGFERGKFKSSSGSHWLSALNKELPPASSIGSRQKTLPWLIAAGAAFLCSFLFPCYFVQFSIATLLCGIKWIVETRSTKILIAIHDAYQRGDSQTVDRLMERLGKR